MADIILADDHALVLEAVCLVLQDRGGHSVRAVPSVEEAITLIVRGSRPDLVLLDYRMSGMFEFGGLRRVRAALPRIPVALISGAAGGVVAAAAIEAGAAGFLSKTATSQDLLEAVDTMLAGRVHAPGEPEAGTPAAALTRREYDVLHGISRGLSNKEIARDLDLSEVTVKLHVKTMCRKLDARNRTHAAMLAMQLGLI
ncbi:MAG: response regulator transcription factor [Pseudooceanicola sp.]